MTLAHYNFQKYDLKRLNNKNHRKIELKKSNNKNSIYHMFCNLQLHSTCPSYAKSSERIFIYLPE